MKLKSWHAVALISCAVWLAYYPALFAPLNSVDDVRLAHDLLNRPGFSWHDFWSPRSRSFFRPLVNSSFILDQLLWGFEASLLHFENLFLHWLNTLLVYVICRKVALRLELDNLLIPVLAALLFGLHPINTEAVIWVAGRADLLATVFVLISLLCALNFFAGGSLSWGVLSALAYLVGALAKETALLLLPGLFLMGWLACKDARAKKMASSARSFLPAAACLISAAAYAGLRIMALKSGDLGTQHVATVIARAVHASGTQAQVDATKVIVPGLAVQLETALRGGGFYARKLVQPFPLNFGIVDVPAGYFWGGCLLIVVVGVLLWRLSWAGCFILTSVSLASIALLVAMGNISWTPYAERYMYAPAAMLAIGSSLAVGGIDRHLGAVWWRNFLGWGFGGLLAFCAVAIFQRTLVWQDNLTLFADTVKKSPNFALAHNQLAEVLWSRGRKGEALDILRRVDMPESQVAYLNKGLVLMEEGKLAEARQFLLENLAKTQARAYHTVILERLVDVVDRQRKASSSATQILLFDDEIIGYLQQLWRRTSNPFYLYRIGQKQMEKGDIASARESFALAYAKSPPGSIYREPSRKLAERLKEQ